MKKQLTLLLFVSSLVHAQVKIPITTEYVWQDNSQLDRADILLDGDTLINYRPQGPTIYNPHEIVFDLLKWNATVSSVRLNMGNNPLVDTTRVNVIVERARDGVQTTIGTWTAGSLGRTTYTNSDTAKVAKIILQTYGVNRQFGSEVGIYGTYITPLPAAKKARVPLGQMAGIDGHSYDFMNDAKLNCIKSLGSTLGGYRVWENAYDVTDASNHWKFEPELGTDRYSTDSAFAILKRWSSNIYTWKAISAQWTPQLNSWKVIDNYPNRYIRGTVTSYLDHGSWGEVFIDVTAVALPTEYNITHWFVYKGGVQINETSTAESFSASLVGQNRHENVGGGLGLVAGDVLTFYKSQESVNPIYFADNDLPRRNTDSAFLLNAQNAYVYASRGGRNTSVPNYTLQSTSPTQRLLKGYNIYNATEGANEPNAWWTNWLGFWNGKTIFYFQDMVYDGAKGMFANAGAKTADSTIDVLLAGLATDKIDQVLAIIDEARKVRGYNADGSVNLPFNVINIHIYSTPGGQYAFSVNGGIPPEQGMNPQIRMFISLIERLAPHCKLFISEWGWDQHPNSAYHAGVFGPYDREGVGAFWMVRAMFSNAMLGTDRMTYFTVAQGWPESSSNNNSTGFETMRLIRQPIDADPTYIVRSRQGDYMAQYNEFKNYIYFDSATTGKPYLHIYRYKRPDNDSAIVVPWSEEIVNYVADTTQFQERTGTVVIPVKAGSYKYRQFMDDSSAVMSSTTLTSTGTVTVNYAAKPIIIQTIIPESNRYIKSFGRLNYKPRH